MLTGSKRQKGMSYLTTDFSCLCEIFRPSNSCYCFKSPVCVTSASFFVTLFGNWLQLSWWNFHSRLAVPHRSCQVVLVQNHGNGNELESWRLPAVIWCFHSSICVIDLLALQTVPFFSWEWTLWVHVGTIMDLPAWIACWPMAIVVRPAVGTGPPSG